MQKTKKSLECRPGRMARIEFNGIDQKGRWETQKQFVVLDKEKDPTDYDGVYACRVASRSNRSGKTFYVAYPMMKLPEYEEMRSKILDDIFSKIEEPLKSEYCEEAYRIFVNMLTDFMLPMNVYIFRILKMVAKGIIESDNVTKKSAADQYTMMVRDFDISMTYAQVEHMINSIGVNDTIQEFLRLFWSLCETGQWSNVADVLRGLFTRQDTSGCNFNIFTNGYLPSVDMRQYVASGRIPESSTMVLVIYDNLEIGILPIQEVILSYGAKCKNYRFTIANNDLDRLVVNVERDPRHFDPSTITFAYEALHDEGILNPISEASRMHTLNSYIAPFAHCKPFVGDTRAKVII